ncbi:unnamed protein product [Amoebophrya sp. A25]|nr:unnamed protein product [Amoebophrya sp. A25]|eukprot:GSA25T00017623001.1
MQKAYITRKDKFHPVQRLGPISKRQSNKDGTSEGASADRPHWQEKNDADVHSGASACYTTSEAQKISAIPWETRLYPDKEERKFSEAAWERFLEEKFVGLDPRHRAPEEVARHQMEAFEMGAAAIRGDNDLVPELDKDRPQRGDSSGQSRGGFDATVAGYEAQLERLRGWRKLLTDILQDVGCRKSEAGHDHVQSPEQLWADAIIRIWHWAEAGRGDRGLGSTSGRKMARTPVNTTPIVQTNFYSRVVQNDGRESQSIAEIEQEDLEFYLKWIERVFPEDGKDAGIERSKARHEVHAFETPSGDAKYLDRLLGRLSLPSASTENLIEGGLLVDFGPAAGTGTRKAATQKHHLPQERGGSRQHAPAFHHANKTGHMKTHLSGNSVGGGGTSPQHGMHMKSSSGTDYSPPHAQTSLKNKSTKAPTFDQELALLDLCVRAEVATNPELEAVYADGGLSLGFGQKSQTRRNAFFGRLRDLPERDVVRLLHGRTQKKLLEAEERRRKAIVTGDHHKPMSEQVQTKAREQLTAAMAKLTCEIFAQRALLQALAKELAATAAGTQADVNDFNAKVAKLRAARGGNQVH